MALVALAVNARHVVRGAALAPWVNRLPPGRRLGALALLNDATFAAGQGAFRAGGRDMDPLLGSGLVLWAGWSLGAVAGAVAGASIGRPAALGFDVVMLAFLTAMVTRQVDRPLRLVPVLVGAAVALLTLPLPPQGWAVIAGALAGGPAGSLARA